MYVKYRSSSNTLNLIILIVDLPLVTWLGDDGIYWKYIKKPTTWDNAKSTCESENGRLAVINTLQSFSTLQRVIQHINTWVWLGARDTHSNNKNWKWVCFDYFCFHIGTGA